jgi:hypothetical protein
MDQKGLDSGILKLLQSDAPELLQELVQKPINGGVSQMHGSTTQPGSAINYLIKQYTSTALFETENTPYTTRNTVLTPTQRNYDLRSQVQESKIQPDTRNAEDPMDVPNVGTTFYGDVYIAPESDAAIAMSSFGLLSADSVTWTSVDSDEVPTYTWSNGNIPDPCVSLPATSMEPSDFVPPSNCRQLTTYRQSQPSTKSSQRSDARPTWLSMPSISQRHPDTVLDYTNAIVLDRPKLSGSALNHFKQLNEQYELSPSRPATQEFPADSHHANQAEHTRYLPHEPNFTYDYNESLSMGVIVAGSDVDQQSLAYDPTVPHGYSSFVGLRGHQNGPYPFDVPGLGLLPL